MIDTLPVPFHLMTIQMPAFYAAMLVLAYILAWPLASRLPKDTPMGLIMCLFIPAFGHLYILRAVSLAYVAGLFVLDIVLHARFGWLTSKLVVTALSAALMYRRLQPTPGAQVAQASPEEADRVALLLSLPPDMNRRLANLAYDLDLSREQAGLRALEAYLAREDRLREEAEDSSMPR
ncbi:hypothetical protein JCM15519_15260 [Fundidesulfovibrio butyratiphilus]